MRNKNKYAEDAKWLSENLNELLHDSPDSDARREKERLAAMLTRFGSLDVSMKDASEKSSVFSKSFEYRDGLERRANWLEETQRMVMEHPAIDSVDDARAYLQEHEVRRERERERGRERGRRRDREGEGEGEKERERGREG